MASFEAVAIPVAALIVSLSTFVAAQWAQARKLAEVEKEEYHERAAVTKEYLTERFDRLERRQADISADIRELRDLIRRS